MAVGSRSLHCIVDLAATPKPNGTSDNDVINTPEYYVIFSLILAKCAFII